MFTKGLIPAQLTVLARIAAWMQQHGYYLAGGTALTIYFAHRLSVDLDWFSPTALPNLYQTVNALQEQTDVTLQNIQIAPGTLYAQISGVQISLLEYRYQLLMPLTIWQHYHCPIASLDDIACMKLNAIAQRGQRKDFIDLYEILLRHKPLPELLNLYTVKYPNTDIGPVFYGLVYFDDAEREPFPKQWRRDWHKLKIFLRQQVKRLTNP